MKKWIGIFLNINLLVGGLIFSLSLAELLLRVFPKYNLKLSFDQYVIKNNPMNKAMNLDREYHEYRPSSILGYEIIPHSLPEINSFGMVGRECKLEKDKDAYRILVLGDSITENNRYVEKLEEKLNNSNPKLTYKFELLNGGVGGYQVNQYAAYLKYKGLRYKPDMVIIGFCLNDFNTLYWVFYKDEKGFTMFYNPACRLSKILHLNRFLFKHSYLYRFLILKIENLLSNSKGKFLQPKTEGLYYLKIIKNICQEKKILLLGVIFPYLKPLSEYYDYEMASYKEFIEVLEILNIDYIDLDKYFLENDPSLLKQNEKDYIHPSKLGHEIAAEAIYECLIKNYFTPSRSEHLMKTKDSKNFVLAK